MDIIFPILVFFGLVFAIIILYEKDKDKEKAQQWERELISKIGPDVQEELMRLPSVNWAEACRIGEEHGIKPRHIVAYCVNVGIKYERKKKIRLK